MPCTCTLTKSRSTDPTDERRIERLCKKDPVRAHAIRFYEGFRVHQPDAPAWETLTYAAKDQLRNTMLNPSRSLR